MLDELPQLPGELQGRELVHLARLRGLHERRALHRRHHQGAHEARLDPVDDARALPGVLEGARPVARAEEDHGGELHARGVRLAPEPDHVRGVHALVEPLQDLVVPGLHPEVELREPLLPELAQLRVRADLDGLGRRVGGHPPQVRERLPQQGEHVGEEARLRHQGVPVGEEDLADVAHHLPGPGDLTGELVEGAHAEALLPVHRAEGAAVVRAADGRLQDQAVRLGGGAVEGPFVLDHGADLSGAPGTGARAPACSSLDMGGAARPRRWTCGPAVSVSARKEWVCRRSGQRVAAASGPRRRRAASQGPGVRPGFWTRAGGAPGGHRCGRRS